MIYLVESPNWEYITFVDTLDAIDYVEAAGCVQDTSKAVQECIEWFGPEILHYRAPNNERVRIIPIKLIGDQQ